MATDKSRRGFQKLETVEMMKFSGNENFPEDSDSEKDLLDFTDQTKGGRSRNYSGGSAHYSGGYGR